MRKPKTIRLSEQTHMEVKKYGGELQAQLGHTVTDDETVRTAITQARLVGLDTETEWRTITLKHPIRIGPSDSLESIQHKIVKALSNEK